MSFDITSVLKNVSDPDTGMEQISYLPLDRLDPDENNFYSLAGIDELADNIATVGLQQPIRVRPGSEAGRYTIVSGHRRRAAIQLLQDGEDDSAHLFDQGVPCIIERGEASPALQELRLIYANAATRVMGPAEVSKQAERVEMLLYQLQEEGMEFKGRMRDHVAEACKVSRSKLARLHAIRKNLAPDILEAYFDTGKLSEATAYAMSQKSPDLQRWIVDQYKTTHEDSADIPEWRVREFSADVEAAEKLVCINCPGGTECTHKREHVEKMWRHGYHGYDSCIRGGKATCCYDCEDLPGCSVSCKRCDAKKQRLKADLAAKRKSERETAKADELNRQLQQEIKTERAAMYWKRLGEALQAKNMTILDLERAILPENKNPFIRILSTYRMTDGDRGLLLQGKPGKNPGAEIPTPFAFGTIDSEHADWWTRMADALDVSLDYLMLRTDQPRPAATCNVSGPDTGLQWSTGTPAEPGMYETRVSVTDEDTPKIGSWQRLEWFAGAWCFPSTHSPMPKGVNVIRWVKLPEV